MSLYAIPQVACRVALGVTMLVTSERTVEILAEAVRRFVSNFQTSDESKPQAAKTANTDKKTANSILSYIDLTTAYAKKEWSSLGISGLMNVTVGAAALFAANRYSPALFTSASSFVRNVVGI